EFGFVGDADENGNARRCPDGSVPFVRRTVEDIRRAGGVHAYLRRRSHPPVHPPATVGPNGPAEVSGYFHVMLKYPLASAGVLMCGDKTCANITGSPPCASGQTTCEVDMPPPGIQGGSTIAAVYAPTPDPAGHSLAQTWTFSGANVSDLTGCHQCTTDCTQTVEIGWVVQPMFETMNVNSPHLFVYSTQDGYWNTGAYAPDPAPPPNCGCEERLGTDCGACLNTVPNPFVAFTLPGFPQYTPDMTVFAASQAFSTPVKEVTFSTVNTGATDPNCYNYGSGLAGVPLGGPAPGGSGWNNYLYYGGLGHACGSLWSGFPGSCDACCTFAPSNVETMPGTCPDPSALTSGQTCDSSCNQSPPIIASPICGG
ncbi:MAG: hypothetical protein ACREJ3_10715, partial [Polyangiaceae bacterium]